MRKEVNPEEMSHKILIVLSQNIVREPKERVSHLKK